MEASLVTSADQLRQIHLLNQQNLKQNLDVAEQASEGFVSWLYSQTLLEQMHRLAPSVIIKDRNKVVAYALTTLKEARAFHPDLDTMFANLDQVSYLGKPLSAHNFYCMGQICIAKPYRGMGLAAMLYQKHKEVYGRRFQFLLTEIATRNQRSLRAHEKTGFQTIHRYTDHMDEWAVVVWNWS